MSANGPESIPTSADPRSQRPTKKRALTPNSSQAASIDALFARPDQEIRIPNSDSVVRRAVPEIVTNVQGSSSGAGSGEFHVYKAARRREYERLRQMDAEVQREKNKSEFEKEKSERDRKDDERTRKNREKREKLKARKAKKGKAGETDGTAPKTAPSGVRANVITRTADEGEEKSEAQAASAAGTTDGPGLVIHDDDD